MFSFPSFMQDALHLLYPHLCIGCGSDILEYHATLCIHCHEDLPKTAFADQENNPVEKILLGRLPIAAAHSEYYFSKGQIMQQLIHALKYQGNKTAGQYLGTQIGQTLLQSSRFQDIDLILPLPMFAAKEYARGYNQATIIAEIIATEMKKTCNSRLLFRTHATDTQTTKDRSTRWENVRASFGIKETNALTGKNILLVDDVITTGATLEACGQLLLDIPQTKLYIVTAAFASH